MGTLKEKLDYLDGTKTAIKDAIVAKGVEVTDADTFRSYAEKITNIPAGGGGDPFSEIGYSATEPKYIRDGIDYAKQILANYDPDVTWYEKWKGDKQLIFFPKVGVYNDIYMGDAFSKSNLQYCPKLDTHNVIVTSSAFDGCSSLICVEGFTDTSKVKNMSNMFNGCSSLKEIPAMNTSSVTNMSSMFHACSSLTSVPAMNTSSVTDMSFMFHECSSLTSVPAMNTSSVTDMSFIFGGCSSLKEIPVMDTSKVVYLNKFAGSGVEYSVKVGGLDLTSATNLNYTFSAWSASPVQYMKLTNLGAQTTVTEIDFSKNNKWGDETPVEGVDVTGAKQSLIDSLLTDSFDRATAGYPVCTLKLNADIQGRLTQEQINAIQAKGYNLTF